MNSISRRTLFGGALGATTLPILTNLPPASAGPPGPRPGAGSSTSLTSHPLPLLPLAHPEIPNSGRGQNFWLGQPSDPKNWPLVDVYRRPDLAWRTIEKRPGKYDWRILDDALAEARARGGRLTWRIMPWYSPGVRPEAPSWIPTRRVVPKDGSAPFTCPDWENPRYIKAWINLIKAMGRHADRNPRLWAVDLSGFGAWGEHYWEDENWGPRMSAAKFRPIVEATRRAFPNTWILGPAMSPGFELMPVVYPKGGKWGTRFDFLGGMELSYAKTPGYADLWKTGPVVTEWGSAPHVTTAMGLKNVKSLHVSVLSSGNKPRTYASMSAGEKRSFEIANKIAGYRLSLDRVELPRTWRAGQRITVRTTWTNHGVAPTYDRWQIALIMQGRRILVQGDLRKVLPGTHTMTHTFVAPAGKSTVGVRVEDPTRILPPMRLANAERREDGSHLLPATMPAEHRRP